MMNHELVIKLFGFRIRRILVIDWQFFGLFWDIDKSDNNYHQKYVTNIRHQQMICYNNLKSLLSLVG